MDDDRFALNYKGVPYETVFVSYPDIRELVISFGAEPGYRNTPHGDLYTLPAIYDPAHKLFIVDSWKIALHLDKHYPARDGSGAIDEAKQILPQGSRMLQRSFFMWHDNVVLDPVADIACMDCPESLDERGAVYFRETRALWWGKPLEEWVKDRPAHWEKILKAYEKLAKLYDEHAGLEAKDDKAVGGAWAMGGETPTFADFVVGGCLIWTKKLNKAEGEGWNVLGKAQGGRWDRFLKKLEPYMQEE